MTRRKQPTCPLPAVDLDQARRLLLGAFTAAGLQIQEDYRYEERGTAAILDGFDPKRKVGYGWITSSRRRAGRLGDREVSWLLALGEKGTVRLLLIDGEGRPDRSMVIYLAREFLKQLRDGETTRPRRTTMGSGKASNTPS